MSTAFFAAVAVFLVVHFFCTGLSHLMDLFPFFGLDAGAEVESAIHAQFSCSFHSQRLAIHQISLASAFIEYLQMLLLLFSGFFLLWRALYSSEKAPRPAAAVVGRSSRYMYVWV